MTALLLPPGELPPQALRVVMELPNGFSHLPVLPEAAQWFLPPEMDLSAQTAISQERPPFPQIGSFKELSWSFSPARTDLLTNVC